jgi:hypothetical protein
MIGWGTGAGMYSGKGLPMWRGAAAIGAIVYGLLGIASFGLAALSFMMFDAPGSEKNKLTIALVFGFLALPCVLLLSALVLAVGFVLRARTPIIIGWWLPAIPVAYVIVVAALLEWVCGGDFSCRHP